MSKSFKKFKPNVAAAETPKQTWFEDFPKEPIGGENPYWMCSHCKRAVPEINYSLEGHSSWCQYRSEKESENSC